MYRVIYYFYGSWTVSREMSYEEAKEYKRENFSAFPLMQIVKIVD